jgi:hypothetical protein
MQNPNNLQLSKFSQNADYEFFFDDEDFQDYEFDRELNQLTDDDDLDEPDDYFWDEN